MSEPIENTTIQTTLSTTIKVLIFIVGSTITIMCGIYQYKNQNSSNFKKVDSRLQSVESKLEVFQVTQANQFTLLKNEIDLSQQQREQLSDLIERFKKEQDQFRNEQYQARLRSKYAGE